MTKKLVCIASSFGYGPVSKLLAIAKALQALDYMLIFVGRGVALELATYFPFTKVIPWEESGNSEYIKQELLGADGIVNVLEPHFEVLARQVPIPHFYVDSLFWMWNRLNAWTAQADIYFIQNFPGVKNRVDEWKAMIRNPQIVGPIVDLLDSRLVQPDGIMELLVNFGGFESRSVQDGGEYVYAHVLTRLLLPLLYEARFENILFTGNRDIMIFLNQKFPESARHVQFVHCSHDDFIARLKNAKLLLSSPGLTSTYEAFLLNIPVRFLPPQNYSQSLMLDHYRENGLVDFSLHWEDLYSQYQLGTSLEVSEAIRCIRSTLNIFSGDLVAQEKASQILRRIIDAPISPAHCFRQGEFAKDMGTPSPVFIASSIANYLR
jgi:hypothetical protein